MRISHQSGFALVALLMISFGARISAEESVKNTVKNIDSLEELNKALKALPKEKVLEFYRQWQREQQAKWEQKLKSNYENGKVPAGDHQIVGVWRDKHDKRVWSFKADGAFERFASPSSRRGTWRIAPSGEVMLKFMEGSIRQGWITDKGFMIWVPGMDYQPPLYTKKGAKVEK